MRQKDKVEKLLEDYPDVFADIINVLIYDGKQVISPKQLSAGKRYTESVEKRKRSQSDLRDRKPDEYR